MQRRIASRILCILCIVLLSPQSESNAFVRLKQLSNCTAGKCVYLPLVIRPIPVIVVNSRFDTVGKRGDIYIQGDIRNDLNTSFGDIIVRAKVYKDDQFLYEIQGKALLPVTLPGQLNIYNFYSGVSGGAPVLSHIRTTVDVLTTTTDMSESYTNLRVGSVTNSRPVGIGLPGTTITITIHNDLAQTVQNVNIQVWSFGSDLSNNNYYICSFVKCNGTSAIAIMSPGQVYTLTVDWPKMDDYGVVVPASVINVVAQGTLSP